MDFQNARKMVLKSKCGNDDEEKTYARIKKKRLGIEKFSKTTTTKFVGKVKRTSCNSQKPMLRLTQKHRSGTKYWHHE